MTNKNKKIVIIEDDRVLRELTQMALSLESYQIEVFENGEQGIEYLEQHIENVDLILLDLFMPVLDGVHVLGWIRKEKQSSVPVIVMTAMNDRTTEQNILSAGADMVIKKPLDINMLLTSVNGIIGN